MRDLDCSECKFLFWYQDTNQTGYQDTSMRTVDHHGRAVGECRRYPAVRCDDGAERFPKAVAWCGEFKDEDEPGA